MGVKNFGTQEEITDDIVKRINAYVKKRTHGGLVCIPIGQLSLVSLF